MKIQITEKHLSTAKPGWYTDRELKGFAVRVNDNRDGHTFYVRRRVNGRLITRRLELPTGTPVKSARDEALAAIVKLETTIMKPVRKKGEKFGDLLEAWIAGENRRKTPSANSQQVYRRLIRHNVPASMLDSPVPSADALLALHNTVKERAPYAAAQMAKVINGTLKKRFPDRLIDPDYFEAPKAKRKPVWKLARFLDALRAMPEERERDALVVALATGLRRCNVLSRGTVGGLRWSDIDFDERTVDVQTKTRRLDLPLADGVLDIIRRQPRSHETVFPFWEARSEEMIDAGVWFHDVRSYFGDIAVKADLPKYVYQLLRGDAAGTLAEQYINRNSLIAETNKVFEQMQNMMRVNGLFVKVETV